MGCGCIKAEGTGSHPDTSNDQKLAQKLQREEERRAREARAAPKPKANWQSAGSGRSLGGQGPPGELGRDTSTLSAEEKRQLALEAAERRQNQVAGVSEKKVQEMRQKEQKDALLGKLAEHYARQKLDMPMGLNAASVEQLKQHWETVRKDRGRDDAILQS
ncbi:unnamed protein product [Durusdinium trenchii]|uniref:Uncharacterized protein n=2 Tax=Durusdinium trenchii TaxID=1381693 RepID=A0ABP0RGD7_9DINO